MDITLNAVIHSLFSLFMKIMSMIGDLNPKTAFIVGAFTWFAIEVSVRKLSNAIRIVIIMMIIGSTSVAALNLFH